MTPHQPVNCIPLQAILTADGCARRHLRQLGVNHVAAREPCGTCRAGASITTMLLDAGWIPSTSSGTAQVPAAPRIRG